MNELTQIVVALVHFCNVNFRGSLGDLYNSVVAKAGEGVLEHSRHHLAACVITSTHPTLVHNFVGAQEVVTANVLQKDRKDVVEWIRNIWEEGVGKDREIY